MYANNSSVDFARIAASGPSTTEPAASASASVQSGRNAPGLCRMAWSKSPTASGEVSKSEIDAEPAETPNTDARLASPPKAAMFARTQRNAAI